MDRWLENMAGRAPGDVAYYDKDLNLEFAVGSRSSIGSRRQFNLFENITIIVLITWGGCAEI